MAQVTQKKRRNVAIPPINAPKAQWVAEESLLSPITKTAVFGKVPNLSLRGQLIFPEGDIHLRYGEHFAANTGFGFQHIWREHFHHVKEHAVAMQKVCETIANCLLPQTPVFYEPIVHPSRLQVFRLHVGSVILELRPEKTTFYSVVTGGFGPINAKGTQLGALA